MSIETVVRDVELAVEEPRNVTLDERATLHARVRLEERQVLLRHLLPERVHVALGTLLVQCAIRVDADNVCALARILGTCIQLILLGAKHMLSRRHVTHFDVGSESLKVELQFNISEMSSTTCR